MRKLSDMNTPKKHNTDKILLLYILHPNFPAVPVISFITKTNKNTGLSTAVIHDLFFFNLEQSLYLSCLSWYWYIKRVPVSLQNVPYFRFVKSFFLTMRFRLCTCNRNSIYMMCLCQPSHQDPHHGPLTHYWWDEDWPLRLLWQLSISSTAKETFFSL